MVQKSVLGVRVPVEPRFTGFSELLCHQSFGIPPFPEWGPALRGRPLPNIVLEKDQCPRLGAVQTSYHSPEGGGVAAGVRKAFSI